MAGRLKETVIMLVHTNEQLQPWTTQLVDRKKIMLTYFQQRACAVGGSEEDYVDILSAKSLPNIKRPFGRHEACWISDTIRCFLLMPIGYYQSFVQESRKEASFLHLSKSRYQAPKWKVLYVVKNGGGDAHSMF